MSEVSACPLCKKEFGIFRHRYECASCKGTFCDDCTPSKFVIPPNTDAARVCTACEKTVRRSAKDAEGGRRLGGDGPNANASDASEREMRARLAEERINAQRLPSSTKRASGGAKLHPPPARKEPEESQPPPAQSQGRTLGSSGGAASPPTGESNPVLAAALRRQQQQQTSTMRPAASMDPERQQILLEIQALLRSRNEEEPFGLRSMDAVKMRLYLKHLREK